MLSDFYEAAFNPDTSTEKGNPPSIKASVNLEKVMTLNAEITEIIDEGCQESIEYIQPSSITVQGTRFSPTNLNG